MRRALRKIAVLLMAACCQTACHAENGSGKSVPAEKASKSLVVYFSATGTTREAAKKLAKVTGSDLLEITPQKPYTAADLDWHDKQSRSTLEMQDEKARPALKMGKRNMAAYKVIYLGYPIWWNQAPRVVNTFVEAYRLNGKTVVPFATSGGSGIENSVKMLKSTYPKVNWQKGFLLNDASESNIKKLVK